MGTRINKKCNDDIEKRINDLLNLAVYTDTFELAYRTKILYAHELGRGSFYKNTNEKLYNHIKEKANELLSRVTNRNPFELAKAIGVNVVFYELDNRLPGFIQDDTIFINDNLDSYSKKIVCSHELGHYMLHKNVNEFELFDSETRKSVEYEANLFAKIIFPQAFARMDAEKICKRSDLNQYVKDQIRYIK